MTAVIDLTERVVLVAGASSGIGRAVALGAADAGARVCLFARDPARLREAERAILDSGGEAVAVAGDAAVPEAAARAVRAAVERYGRLDALVNTVGINVKNRALTALTWDTWHELITANLHAAYTLTQAVLPVFRERGGGLLVHLSSQVAKRPDASGVGYQAARARLLSTISRGAYPWRRRCPVGRAAIRTRPVSRPIDPGQWFGLPQHQRRE